MNKEELNVLSNIADGLFRLSEEVRDLALEVCKLNRTPEQITLEAKEKPEVEVVQEPLIKEEEKFTFEEIRGLMAELSSSGKKEEAKAILHELGVKKLSDVKQESFAYIAKKAKELING